MVLSNEADILWTLEATGGGGGGAGFPILDAFGPNYVGKYAGLGEVSGDTAAHVLDVGGAAEYDFRGTGKRIPLLNTPGTSGDDWDGNRNLIRLDSGQGSPSHDSAYVGGGYIICPNMDADFNWNELYDSSNDPVASIQVREITAPNMVFDGFRGHGAGWDVIQTGSGVRNSATGLQILRFGCTLIRDDAFEMDNRVDAVVIDDCYAEAFVFYSSRNSSSFDGSSRTNTISNSLSFSLPCRINQNPNRLNFIFKLDSKAPQLIIQNCIFAIPDGTPDSSGALFGSLINNGKLHASSADNAICLLGGQSSVPNGNPDASKFNVLTGSTAQSFWDNALTDWWDTVFPGHRFNEPGVIVDPPAP